MALSLGIEYVSSAWYIALREHLTLIETKLFPSTNALLAYLEDICAYYPEPVITLATQMWSDSATSEAFPLYKTNEMQTVVEAIKTMSLTSYRISEINQLASIPRHRKLNRTHMGSSSILCSVATLLYRMRLQDAAWPEMRFFLLSLSEMSRSIAVIQDGFVVDGMACVQHKALYDDDADNDVRQLVEDAFWEGLAQDLAGLMAVHHCEDIVLLMQHPSAGMRKLYDAIIDRLGDLYPCYLFPAHADEPENFEAALGAAIISEGLHSAGIAAEVVEHLHLTHLSHL